MKVTITLEDMGDHDVQVQFAYEGGGPDEKSAAVGLANIALEAMKLSDLEVEGADHAQG